ncbi:MAG TPA: M28 family peptidase [Ferruginibacter sp.]|nr:M28 family peptidase [Ferruginibacter sp.]HMP20677.1 M28 family peptidase [Ferruginibacter sp.]
MKNFFLFFLFSGSVVFVKAQADTPSRYAALITTGALQHHLTIIAGDEMEGRETGTDGQRKAAAYIEEQFKKIGLQPPAVLQGYQQYYPVLKDSITAAVVKINNNLLQYGSDYYSQAINNQSRRISTKKIVFAGYGISEAGYDDYAGIDAKGKVVVVFLGEPKKNGQYLLTGNAKYSAYTYPGISKKIDIAKAKGAAAVVFINPAQAQADSATVKRNSQPGLFYPRSGDNDNPNYIVLSHQAATANFTDWPTSQLIVAAKAGEPFSGKGLKELDISFSFDFKKQRLKIDASNVIGIVEGSDKKDEYVFVTAHYDHLGRHNGKIYYGADDDGSGTCAVILMAEAFAKAKAEGHGPSRTMVFMTVSGEEKGLWGSKYYSENPVFPMDKTSVDLNIDMVGRIDTERLTADTQNYVYVIGHNMLSTELQPVSEGMNTKYTGLILDYKFDDPDDPERIFYRSDHYNFAKNGVPILFFYDGMLKADYHKPTDTVDKINWELYQKRVHMIFYTAWEIANRPLMLKRDLPIPEGTR